MKAEPEYVIEHMFDNKRQYIIPVYQRNYDWKKDNCLELFNDIISAYNSESTHFLGTIVQVQLDEDNGIKRYIIIDGQQRMTSIYLLLKAMFDLSKNAEEKENISELLFNRSSSKKYDKDDVNKLKLKPIKSDNEQFTLLMSDKINEMDKGSNIYINYEYFKDLIIQEIKKEHTIKQIKKGLEYLQIVMISLKEPEDKPQVVFERINSTGEDLKLADLIRNYLLMTDINMDELYYKYWVPMEQSLGKDHLNDYLINFLNFKLSKFTSKDAYHRFKSYIENQSISHEDILNELLRFSKYYCAFISNQNNDYSSRVNQILYYFRLLKQTTIYPFLFPIFNDRENEKISENTLEDVLLFMLNYTVRRMVIGVPSNSLNGLYKTLYSRIFEGEICNDNYLEKIQSFFSLKLKHTRDRMQNDDTFKSSLMNEQIYNKPNKICLLLLEIIENGIFPNKEKIEIDENITIEHIMPQEKENPEKLSYDWKTMLGAEWQYIYETYLHTIGNLTLTGYNGELSDKPFSEKKEIIKNKSKFSVLNAEILNVSKWDRMAITNRADILSDRIINEFKLPKIFNESKDEGLFYYNVDGNTDFTNFKPDSIIFLGEEKKLKKNTMVELLTSFCELLADLENEKFIHILSNPNINKNISYDKDLLGKAKEIGNTGIYIEINKSANEIIRTIRKIIDEFDLTYDDFTFTGQFRK